MKDVLDILYDSQIQTNAYNRKVSTEIDTIDECCDDMQRAIFKKGVAIGISIMQEVIKQNEKSSDTPLRKLFENM